VSKESDRVSVLAEGITRLGGRARAGEDCLEIGPPPASGLRGARISTSSDHRIAMAFAVAGLRIPGVEIDDEGVVAKSYPRFWRDFSALERG
jgi:3-phosphoshikimate 1-carboxyvinyltransferase